MNATKPAFLVGLLGTGIGAPVVPEVQMSKVEQLGLRYVYRMVVLQADEQMRLFTGEQPNAERMLAAYAS